MKVITYMSAPPNESEPAPWGLPRQDWLALRERSSWRGSAVVADAGACVAGAIAMFAVWPNPLTFSCAFVVVSGHQLVLAILMLDRYFCDVLAHAKKPWLFVFGIARECGIATPGLNASLDYYDGYRQARGLANLIQAQRDYFGAHTYERVDRPGHFRTNWTVVYS